MADRADSADSAADSAAADDAALARYGLDLAEAVERALGPWVRASVGRHLAEPHDERISALTERAAADAVKDVGGRLRELLAADIDDQWTNPLSIIRSATAYPTAVLAEAGVPEVARDETERRLYPDDRYGLVPASFADLGPEVHEPGINWGAAKAHVHLRRRKAADA